MEDDEQEVLISLREGLPSLQFESLFIPESVSSYVTMRNVSHASVMQHASSAGYFVRCLSLARRLCAAVREDKSDSVAVANGGGAAETDELMVGVCGCGRLGRTVAEALLLCGSLTSQQLLISTRRPELLDTFKSQGVHSFFDNATLFSHCNVIFLCVSPTQLRAVCDQLLGVQLRPHTLIYSFVAGYNCKKLSRLLLTTNIIVASLAPKTGRAADPTGWKLGCTLRECMESRDALTLLCPLHVLPADWFFDDCVQLVEQFAFALLNYSVSQGLDRRESLRVLNHTLLGEPFTRLSASARDNSFTAQDCNLTGTGKERNTFGAFNLLLLDVRDRRDTGVRKKLLGDALLRGKFVNTFIEAVISSIKWLKFEQR